MSGEARTSPSKPDAAAGASSSSASDIPFTAPEPVNKITWALQEASSIVVVDDDDVSEAQSRQRQAQNRRQSQAPSVDVRELARRRGSDPFTGYNVADIYDDPEVSSMAKSATGYVSSAAKETFDPKTFQLYAPAMDVDALCSELLNLAGDMLANPNTIMSASTSPTDDAADDAEELARQRLRRLRSSGHMSKTNSFAKQGRGPNYVLHIATGAHGVPTPLSPLGDPLHPQGVNESVTTKWQGSVSPLSPTVSGGTSSQRATPRFTSGQYSETDHSGGPTLTPRSAAASNVHHLQQTIRQKMQHTIKADANATRKVRLQMMLEGLRNGDFNADFIQSIQQLQDPDDAVKAITAYYEQGKDVAHHKAMAARRNVLAKMERRGTFRFAAGGARPSSGSAAPRRSMPSVTLSDPGATPRAGTPPSGDHDRRKVLIKILEQRRESEIQRINDKKEDLSSAPVQLQRQRSLVRAQSLANISLKSFVRRRSSWMRANGTVSSSVGALSTRWRRRTIVGGSMSAAALELAASLPSGATQPDVFMLFFESEKGPLTVQEVVASTVRFLGTVSYVYLFPAPPPSDATKLLAASTSKSPRTPKATIVAPPPSTATPIMEDSLRSQVEMTALSGDAVAALYGALHLEATQALEEDGASPGDKDVAAKAAQKARELLFPLLHRRLCRQLQDNTLNDFGKGTSGILFFSSVSKFASTIETCETTQGAKIKISKGPLLGSASTLDGASPLSGVSLQALMSGNAAAIAFELTGKGTYADFLQQQTLLQSPPTTQQGRTGAALLDTADIEGWTAATVGGAAQQKGIAAGGAGRRAMVNGDGAVMDESLAASESPRSDTARRAGDKPADFFLSVRASSPSSQAVSLDGIVGVQDHVRRVAMSRLSVLQYPPSPNKEYHHVHEKHLTVPSPPSRGDKKPSPRLQQHKPDPLAPWLLQLHEREEEFPPNGLDVAPGVRIHHIPRIFEGIAPRPPAPNTRVFTPKKQSPRGDGATSPRLVSNTVNGATYMSPSGCMVHRVQPIPHKLLHTAAHPSPTQPSHSENVQHLQWGAQRTLSTPAAFLTHGSTRFPMLTTVPSPHHPITSASLSAVTETWSGARDIGGGNNSQRDEHLVNGGGAAMLTPFLSDLRSTGEDVALPIIPIAVPISPRLGGSDASTSLVLHGGATIQSRRLVSSRQGRILKSPRSQHSTHM